MKQSGPLFGGFDGGGTRTRMTVIDVDGAAVYTDEGPATNVVTFGADTALTRLFVMLEYFQRLRPELYAAVSAFTFGLAGVEGSDHATTRYLSDALTERLQNRVVNVVNDGYIALYAGYQGAPGIAIISGTGSVCYGADSHGSINTKGGMGSLLADNGSGYQIGLHGIRSAIRTYNGIGPDTMLCESVQSVFSLSSLSEAPNRIRDREEIASFARQVHDAALKADEVSIGIIERAALDLSQLVESVWRSGSFSETGVSVTSFGGCIDNMHELSAAFVRNLDRSPGRFKVCNSVYTPQHGAAQLARQTHREQLALMRCRDRV